MRKARWIRCHQERTEEYKEEYVLLDSFGGTELYWDSVDEVVLKYSPGGDGWEQADCDEE